MWAVGRRGTVGVRRGVGVAFRYDAQRHIGPLRPRPTASSVGSSGPLPALVGLEETLHQFRKEFLDFKKQIEGEFREVRGELENQKSEFREVRGELENQKSEFREVRGELENQKSEFREVRGELENQKSEFREVRGELENQKSFHREWCSRDIVVVAAEVLKWSVGVRGRNDGKGQYFWAADCQKQVQVGAGVFKRTVPDYQSFSRIVILSRNSEVHFGSVKDLDDRVAVARAYIQIQNTGEFLKISRPREVEVILAYEELKIALPQQFS